MELGIIVVGLIGYFYTQKADMKTIHGWIQEHETQTALGYERLRQLELLTTEISTLVKQHDKELDRLQR